jgi:hypothetical protein
MTGRLAYVVAERTNVAIKGSRQGAALGKVFCCRWSWGGRALHRSLAGFNLLLRWFFTVPSKEFRRYFIVQYNVLATFPAVAGLCTVCFPCHCELRGPITHPI